MPAKFFAKKTAPALREWFESQTGKYLKENCIVFENDGGRCEFIGVDNKDDRAWDIFETTNPEKPFWVTPNDLDPDNSVSPKEMAQRLIDTIENLEIEESEFEYDENDPKTWPHIKPNLGIEPESFYGCYVATIEDAFELIKRYKGKPAAELSKDYNKPVPVKD